MFMNLKSFILSVMLTGLPAISYASVADKEFSADAVVSIPGQQSTTSKLFVGESVVRTETQTADGVIIDIVFTDKGKLIKLNTRHKQFIEMPVQKLSPAGDSNPCSRIRNASCTFMGNETIDGLETQKWQIIASKQGKNVRTLHWVDVNRQLAVREFFNDGSMAEMKLEAHENINGRDTERWIRTISRPDGSTVSSYQWYDPQLEISIKESLPGGYVRELKNIIVKKQNAELFIVPQGYKMMRPEQLPAQTPVRGAAGRTNQNINRTYR
jgi:hypothetical protein